MNQKRAAKSVRVWLIVGLVMVFLQILIGGVTRLTGSGLSITEWNVVLGIFPPMNAAEWNEAFHKYQQIDQYKLVNSQMSLSEFKYIFFWEWFHRLWARAMGFVFLIPLIYFVIRGRIAKHHILRYSVLLFLGGLAGVVGWLMVMSGMQDDKVLVNPLNLMVHLIVASAIFIYLFRLILEDTYPKHIVRYDRSARRLSSILLGLVILQIALGGIVAGSVAALSSTTWPLMNGSFIPSGLGIHLPYNDFMYENNITIQFTHRMVAYLITIYAVYYFWKTREVLAKPIFHTYRYLMIVVVFVQVVLGILTILNSKGAVPVGLGVMHQLVAFILLNIVVGLHYFVKYRAISMSSVR
ncbi:MAG TPA: COX15/CtaA family protein [Chitinophagales bacterium]|nr:COX15/CtaA family protein [Chitinophagales bacterium]